MHEFFIITWSGMEEDTAIQNLTHIGDSMAALFRLCKKHGSYHHTRRKHKPCHPHEPLDKEIMFRRDRKSVV